MCRYYTPYEITLTTIEKVLLCPIQLVITLLIGTLITIEKVLLCLDMIQLVTLPIGTLITTEESFTVS